MINVGNVVGLIKSVDAPSKTFVLWAKILNPSFPNIVDILYYDSTSLAWTSIFESTTQYWLKPVIQIRTSPPASPADGDRYLIADTGASGIWAGREDQVATYRLSNWIYQAPLDGYIVTVRTQANRIYEYVGVFGSGGVWDVNDFQVPITPGDYIPSIAKGTANGVVPLDPDSKILATYINGTTLPFSPTTAAQWPAATATLKIAIEHLRTLIAGISVTTGFVSSVNGLTPDGSGAISLPAATDQAAGLMSAADKDKLDNFTPTLAFVDVEGDPLLNLELDSLFDDVYTNINSKLGKALDIKRATNVSTYQVILTDGGKHLVLGNSGGCIVTLTATADYLGFQFTIENTSSGPITFQSNATISSNTGSNQLIGPRQTAHVYYDGSAGTWKLILPGIDDTSQLYTENELSLTTNLASLEMSGLPQKMFNTATTRGTNFTISKFNDGNARIIDYTFQISSPIVVQLAEADIMESNVVGWDSVNKSLTLSDLGIYELNWRRRGNIYLVTVSEPYV